MPCVCMKKKFQQINIRQDFASLLSFIDSRDRSTYFIKGYWYEGTSLPSDHFLTSGTRSRRSHASTQRSKAHRLDVVTRELFHVSRRYYGTSQGAYLHDKTRRHFGASVSLTYFVSAARKTTR